MLKGPRQRHRELKDSAWTPLCQPLGDPVSLDLNSWTISSLQVIPNCAQLPPLTPSPRSFSAAPGSAPAHMEAFVLFRSGGQKKPTTAPSSLWSLGCLGKQDNTGKCLCPNSPTAPGTVTLPRKATSGSPTLWLPLSVGWDSPAGGHQSKWQSETP